MTEIEPPLLPDFPVDESALAMLDAALNPGPDAEQTSVSHLLMLYSEMAGSDTTAVAEVHELDDGPFGVDKIYVMRDRQYSEHDVMRALIAEIRHLRKEATR